MASFLQGEGDKVITRLLDFLVGLVIGMPVGVLIVNLVTSIRWRRRVKKV